MKTLYFDVMSGASGDMILAALVDCGVPIGYLQDQIRILGLPVEIDAEKTVRNGISCTHMVLKHGHSHEYRHLTQITGVIGKGNYQHKVHNRCIKVLTRLGEAEAAVHGIPLEKVHFHEIGAVDTIVDILGASLCLEYLGIDEIAFSVLTDGHGSITTAHGIIPVPVPATARMLQGFELRTLDIPTELLTPTGCAILTGLGRQSRVRPEGVIAAMGYGCGDKVFDKQPNVLRVSLVDTREQAGHDSVWVLESDMDHVSGEVMGYTAEACMAAGALDVSWTPVFMKKGRPGYRLTVLCKETDRVYLIDLVIGNTRTLGVRYYPAQRTICERSSADLGFMGRIVSAKTCTHNGRTFKKPEYESMAALAREVQRPVIDIMDQFLRENNTAD